MYETDSKVTADFVAVRYQSYIVNALECNPHQEFSGTSEEVQAYCDYIDRAIQSLADVVYYTHGIGQGYEEIKDAVADAFFEYA